MECTILRPLHALAPLEHDDSTSLAVTGHWRRQLDELLDQARQTEEELADAREIIRSLARQHEAQWQASRDRWGTDFIYDRGRKKSRFGKYQYFPA